MNSSKAIKQLKFLKKEFEKESSPRLAAEGWEDDWKTLIAIILSAQTRDTKTISVCNTLFKKFDSPENLGKAKIEAIEKEIGSINYYKTKARNIKETSIILSKINFPETFEQLIKLPGVGRKTANVFLAERRKAAAIGVDTHVSRLAIKLGWTKKKFSDKKGIEEDLQDLFPKRYWNSINYILVSFGQTIGKKRKEEDKILKELKSKKDL